MAFVCSVIWFLHKRLLVGFQNMVETLMNHKAPNYGEA